MAKKPKIKEESYKKRRDKPVGITEKVINILKILNLIEQGKAPSAKALAEECEVSERSIYRYLNILSSVVPIVYDPKKKGYRLENEKALRVIPLEREELALLSSLMDFLSKSGKDLSVVLKGVIDKLFACTKDGSLSGESVYKFLTTSPTETKFFNEISKALLEQRQVKIVYHSLNTDDVTERLIDPLGMLYLDGVWFVFAYCHLREDYRTFSLDRIREIEILNVMFKKPEGFNLEDRISESWGVWEGERVTVKVRFSKEIANVIRRKPKWHPSQKTEIMDDGSLELTFNVSGVDEIKWWIYSFIPHVRVISPEKLREQFIQDLQKTLKENNL